MSTEFKLYNINKQEMYKNKSKEEREKMLIDIVEYALKYGNKPAARYYNTYPSTVRRWVKVYKEKGKEGLKFNK